MFCDIYFEQTQAVELDHEIRPKNPRPNKMPRLQHPSSTNIFFILLYNQIKNENERMY